MLGSAQDMAVLIDIGLLVLILCYILSVVHKQSEHLHEIDEQMKLYEKGKEELAKTEK